MKIKTVVILSFIYFLVTSFPLIAQQPVQSDVSNKDNNPTIIEELNARTIGQGSVTVYQDEAIKGLLAKAAPVKLPVFSTGDGSVQYVKLRGYRIQVFSGNDQRKSKNEAYYKQRLINDSFGNMETTVYFKSPRWILRAGNFKSREEANAAMNQIKQQFPNFGKEMYIISDTVKVPL